MLTQCEQVEKELRAGRRLTRFEATMEFGILNLWQRVRELKEAGLDIQCDMETRNGKRVGVYYLAADSETGQEGLPS